MSKFFVTTPIYYVNDRPHVGHAYATFAADVFARYHRMVGHDTLLLTGTDEQAQKNVEAANASGEQDVQDYVDRMSALWQMTWDELGIGNDVFIRTTEPRHRRGVEQFWQAVHDRGDIYKGTYEGLYCTGCEAFYRESDLTADGSCLVHNRKAESLKEENYFFRASAYRDRLLMHLNEHPEFVQPANRHREVVNYLTDHFADVSISRPNKGWGIPVPGDESQVIYVWFDALVNYLTAIGYGTDDAEFRRWWPADLHVVGKDIIKFHCALWPAMLLSAGLPLPLQVFAHGFFTIDGQKISKSLGNAIDPRDLVETYGVDCLRYFLLREIPFGSDGDFSIERIAARYDSDLASGLGNFVSRVFAFHADVSNPTIDNVFASVFRDAWQRYHRAMAAQQPAEALAVVWEIVKAGDRYLDEQRPWEMRKHAAAAEDFAMVIGTLLEILRQLAWLLLPLMPDTSAKLFTALGCEHDKERAFDEATNWGAGSGFTLQPPLPLFPRLTS